MSDATPPAQPPRRAPLFRNPWLWGVVACLALPWLVRPLTRREPEAPPVLLTLPPFSLIDQDEKPFNNRDLRGRVSVVGFVFSSCTTVCPTLLSQVKKLEDRVAAEERVVSQGCMPEPSGEMRFLAVTVDPETDDPAKLRELRDRHDLDAARWTLLTGPPDELRSLLQSGFALAVGEKQETAPGVFEIAHSAKLALLDQDGGVRGFYDSDERGLDELYWRAQHVLREQRREAGRAGRR